MRFFLIDATAKTTEPRFRGLALKYISWEIEQQGSQIVDDWTKADAILVSVVSPHEHDCVRLALKKYKIEPFATLRCGRFPPVVIGGQGAMSPAIFDQYADLICVGEGANFIKALCRGGVEEAAALPNAWIPGDTKLVIPDSDFPYYAPPVMAEDKIVRVFGSRGCQKKCLFCQTGWEREYNENDEDTLLYQYEQMRKAGYRVNVVTNDAPAMSFFSELGQVEHFSASYSQTLEIIEKGNIKQFAGNVKSVRLGVEAPSDRLRKYVGKPVPTEGLYDVSVKLLNAGVGVRWFMIAGLPFEKKSDWDELKQVVQSARHHIKKGALQLSFTAFCPDSAAPLCIAPLDDDYWDRYKDFNDWFFDGLGYTRKVQIFKCAQPKGRMEHAKGSMAATEAEIRRGWETCDPPNWRVQYPYKSRMRKAYEAYKRRCQTIPIVAAEKTTDRRDPSLETAHA
jgi:radical SAM superfamily enzyme YgiQ (UPF0313 family)